MEFLSLESSKHREEVNEHIRKQWGLPVITRGSAIDVVNLPGFIAHDDGELIGAILYQIKNGECEIAVLFSLRENIGVGSGLLKAVVEAVKEHGCRRVWLITTNDNAPAIRYYQKRGFSLKAVHTNAFKITQKLKGMGDETIFGIDGIPILHEVEFELVF